MRGWAATLTLAAIALLSGRVLCQEGKERLVLETWDAVYLEGARAGHVHTKAVESTRNGVTLIRTSTDLQIVVKRFKQVLQLRQETGDDETADGQVLGTFMRQNVARNKEVLIIGIVKDREIDLLLDGKAGTLKPAPWDKRALGLLRLQSLWSDRKVTPGTAFSYQTFEPTVSLVMRMDVTVKDFEEIEILPGKGKQRLLRAETIPEKLEGLQLPPTTTWLDANLQIVRQDTELPGLGKISMIRTTRDVAMAAGAEAAPADVGLGQVIRLNKRIASPHDKVAVVFRMTIKGEDDAASTITQDARQQIVTKKGPALEVRLTPARGPSAAGETVARVEPEWLQSSYYITSADARVRELARKAVGREIDPWKKALAIEKWVYRNMRATNAEGLLPADQVARGLEGDCTEYSMLAAAMCRAEGIPSKTAIGLIYQDAKVGPAMVFHMWTEVLIERQWLAIDSTLGRGGIGATHLKITDHSWHDVRSMSPLIPLTRIAGRTQLEVISAR